ncbi:hypothetical protein OROGR_008359 [Orobanche gracilis]
MVADGERFRLVMKELGTCDRYLQARGPLACSSSLP